MSKEKSALVQIRVYLPGAELERSKRLADRRKLSVSALLAEYLSEYRSRAIGAICLPVSRADWHIITLRVERDLYEALHERAAKLQARPWDLISAILLAAIPKK